MTITNILMAGTGGQGIVLASRIIAQVAFKNGFDVKESEIHGMAQRGGSVVGHIRFGKKIYSSAIPLGQSDILVALEEMEGIRYLPFLKHSGTIILNRKKITPALTEEKDYPENIEYFLKERHFSVYSIDAEKVAKDLGNIKVENSVILGFLSAFLNFDEKDWIDVIKDSVPSKTVDLNIKAFQEGRRLAKENEILGRRNRNFRKTKTKRTST
ncbi:MAG: indolepyruvate oxidoreductase subunit beta [Thermodesulfovibrio sp.]|nr:indolepyruvate oxidoreductase subunit beta [Thermodesulfovibrio sp.]